MLDSQETGGTQDPSRGTTTVDPSPAAPPATAPQAVDRGGMFADPIVRIMALVAGSVFAAFLLFVVVVLYQGYLDPVAPRTYVETKLAEKGSLVDAGISDPQVWREYVTLLIRSKQYARAQSIIDSAEGVIDDEWGQQRLVMQAELYVGEKKFDEALKAIDEAQTKIMEIYNEEAAKPDLPNRAKAWGIPPEHAELSLMKARIFIAQEKYPEAQEEIQQYADANPTEAGILIDLGKLKVKNGDIEGARTDLQKALKFLPDNAEIIAELEKIGAE